MLQPPWEYVRDRLPFGQGLSISSEIVDTLVCASKAEPWHSYAIHNRHRRPHVYVATRWLAQCLAKDATIFEPGCGSGVNLLWLAQQGFSHLKGSDISAEAVGLSQKLATALGKNLDVWQDDCIKPALLPQNLDAILSVNWLYHIPQATLQDFLALYYPTLKKGGTVVFDMVTRHYDRIPNNQYHSKDWNLPLHERRPSEYSIRLHADEVDKIAKSCGFRVRKGTCLLLSRPQRAVYELHKI